MKRIIINGATGAIGIALIKKCIKENVNVLVLTHKNSLRNKYIPDSDLITIIECDLEQLKDFTINTKQKYDVFYHFAWIGGYLRDDVYLQKCNLQYTLAAVEFAARMGCETFIGAGSQAEYGIGNCPLSGNTPTFPNSAFGATKLYAGYMSKILAHQLGMNHIWARILSVYGPCDGQKTMIVSTIEKLLKKEKPEFTRGEQKWDYLFSSDAAEAMYLLGEKGKDSKIYCIGSGIDKPLKEYIIQLRDAINPNLPLGIGELPYSDNQNMNLCADISELKNDIGFEPKVEFSDGIRQTINWVIEKG